MHMVLDLIQMAVVYSVVLHGHLSMCTQILQFTVFARRTKREVAAIKSPCPIDGQ